MLEPGAELAQHITTAAQFGTLCSVLDNDTICVLPSNNTITLNA